MKIAFFSDTHNYHDKLELPEADIAIHAGDATGRGGQRDIVAFAEWYRNTPYLYKIFVAGNHDLTFEDHPELVHKWLRSFYNEETGKYEELADSGIIYLQDDAHYIEVNGVSVYIYGAPHTPAFHNWGFNLQRGLEIKEKWDLIPFNTDILVTHGPPYGLRDKTDFTEEHVGCKDLLHAIEYVKPKIHVFGHIHEGYGVEKYNDTTIINASNCTVNYAPSNPVIVMEISDDGSCKQLKV